ncbi:LOW QUALITY PROTEIN: chitobiosyldiphosphodolichol beta-mannosyltransferase-like [Pollicipes pollicipes]|uniref:LOW QUALITY PROTEIN: chitobiosyldiphosphodolichol beta-mannosyltransferase-like n=1 Tax=Pollicipes pollicipes TaxID=41117 RepID=UPI001884DEB6|nr:LOW QUALITY PROTEIN: chitobiosyldiphosphodolichol beta-mannosyltransferase-like [Pollicipes pollicipes]
MSAAKQRPGRVCVVVLGDVGRSPRMCYHAQSLAQRGHHVDVVGYLRDEGSELSVARVASVYPLRPVPSWVSGCPRLLAYLLKALWQAAVLFAFLMTLPRFNSLLLQNPPGVPTLPVSWLACRLRRARLIIDWHNYSYTIMALSVGRQNLLVKLTKWLESAFGRRADANLCVTAAMQEDLAKHWGIVASPLHDRPAARFRPVPPEETHELFVRLGKLYQAFSTTVPDRTAFTERHADGSVRLFDDRPGLLVSGTSWTEDEDFSVLLHALQEYETTREERPHELPRLLCVITGRGPLKQFYCQLMERKNWNHVEVLTPWLAEDDYPRLLASADLGVSLHTSSSGLDLPMKVVDMFGAGLPVCAYNFKCLSELVRHGENGFVFSSSSQLAEQLIAWFRGFPHSQQMAGLRRRFREQIAAFRRQGWDENWGQRAGHLFEV